MKSNTVEDSCILFTRTKFLRYFLFFIEVLNNSLRNRNLCLKQIKRRMGSRAKQVWRKNVLFTIINMRNKFYFFLWCLIEEEKRVFFLKINQTFIVCNPKSCVKIIRFCQIEEEICSFWNLQANNSQKHF